MSYEGRVKSSLIDLLTNRGWEAYFNGVHADDCPYTSREFSAAWHRGWQAAEDEYRDEIIAKMGSR